MRPSRHALVTFALSTLAACGGDASGKLDDYFPPLPPTGGATGASAGQVTSPAQLLTGPAQSGLVGDFFIKNEQVTFIIQAPTRVIGVIPQGGNVVDAALTDGTHQTVDDHFGELALIFGLGRTCEHTSVEIVLDGSAGGPAVIRAVGKSGNDDFINIKGIGALPVDPSVDPDVPDGIVCATTYVLAPGSNTMTVYHSLYNSGAKYAGPLGTIADTGGNTESFGNGRGFERADVSALTSLVNPSPIDYVIYQGPGVAYGVIPRHDQPAVHTAAMIAGVSILLDGNDNLLDILNKDKYFLHLDHNAGLLQRYDLVVGKDGDAIDQAFRAGNQETLAPISGHVTWSAGGAATGARVGIFADGNKNGTLDGPDVDLNGDMLPDDKILTYLDVAADGSYSGVVPTTAGNLLVRAEVKNVGRSAVAPAAATLDLTVPSPLKIDYEITDDATGMPIPGRLLVIGDHPAYPDKRVFETADRVDGVVTAAHSIRGTTVDLGDGADPALYLPAGGTYRIYASRGTEWSIDSKPVTAAGSLTFKLRQVVPTPGYLATDWHVHQVGSPDSPILSDERIRSAVSAGVEMFACTDHDYVSDLQPLVKTMGLDQLLRVLPGIEVTPFAYGHFNAWPMTPLNDSANHGAIDWAQDGVVPGQAMTPKEIFGKMRDRGAQMVQVNHPRNPGFTSFQSAFIRANVKYDFTARTIYGDYMNADIPNDELRLPGESLWSDQFNGLEIWNGFGTKDSNNDGLREDIHLDSVLRDWFSMLSLGFFVTPAGDSDTHTTVADPLGMPRTYIRVTDDSPAALASGAAADDVLATQLGTRNGTSVARDVVVTNGPMIAVTFNGQPALGSVATATGGQVTLQVTVQSADWAEFDTLEVFANATPDPVKANDTTLTPLKCWTARPLAGLAPTDPCKRAALAPEAMTVTLVPVGTGGAQRFEVVLTITLATADVAAATRAGATGKDGWLVFRARGDRAIFPVLPNDVVTAANLPVLLGGDFATIRAALAGQGIQAMAVTSPVFVDFDGGGYRAPFAP
jgi:hypothetical protein